MESIPVTSLVLLEGNMRLAPPPPCALRIFIDNATGAYGYRFSENAILLEKEGDPIEFFLVNEIPNASVGILKHISTPCEPAGTSPRKVTVESVDSMPPPDGQNPYANKPKRASYTFVLEEYEMLNIGLVVEIEHNDGRPPFRMICDPQVGNGPP